VITFEDVTKVYASQARPALRHVNLDIDAGEFVFLVGQSGSGKSTCLRLIMREYRPSLGRVLVDGHDVGRLREWRVPALRRQLGVVFQDFRLLPDRTVFENVAFAMRVVGRSAGSIRTTVPQVLELVGLDKRADRLPDELSGGEQQRVGIARAVVNRPKILLADEPTGNLDPDTSVGIMRLLDRINKAGTTVVMATHDASVVDQMRRRVVEIVGGQIVRDQAKGLYGTR